MGLMVLAKKGGERSGVRSLLHFFLGSRDSQSLFLDNGFRWANGVPMASQRNSSRSYETFSYEIEVVDSELEKE
jgi:hypothetical protein